MSEPQDVGKFEIELPDGQVLERDDMVEDVDHGPMVVKAVRYNPTNKTVHLASELGPEALTLTGEEIREEWGETMAFDPWNMDAHGPRVTLEGIGNEASDVRVDLDVTGDDQDAVETVGMYLQDRAVRAIRAFETGAHPDDVDGSGLQINWDELMENDDE